MPYFILLALPLVSQTFFFEGTTISRIYLTLFDFVIPFLWLSSSFFSRQDFLQYYKEHKSEILFLTLYGLGIILTLSYPEISYSTLMKDLLKTCLFIFALNVYKTRIHKEEIQSSHLSLITLASILMLYLRHEVSDAGIANLTPLANYSFYMWLLSTITPKKNLILYSSTTTLLLIQLYILRRSEIFAFTTLSLVILGIDYFKLTARDLLKAALGLLIPIGITAHILSESILQSALVRVSLWICSFNVGVKNFPWGIGIGQYQAQQITDFSIQPEGGKFDIFQLPHNQFLFWFAELGLIGILLGLILMRFIYNHTKHLSFYWRYFICGVLFISSFTHDIISFRVFPIFLALIYILSQDKNPTKELPSHREYS